MLVALVTVIDLVVVVPSNGNREDDVYSRKSDASDYQMWKARPTVLDIRRRLVFIAAQEIPRNDTPVSPFRFISLLIFAW